MRYVDQTTFGAPGGNCFSACVASMLEIPLDAVPYFMGRGGEWFTYFEEWLQPHGYYPVCFNDANYRPQGLYILSGKSPRGDFLHSVIARGLDVVHDPHPSRAGVELGPLVED